MKKLRFLFFTLALVFAFSIIAFAADSETRDFTFETELAADLKALGLFSGVSDTDFDLERVPTRLEVLVMLIRVLGEEKTALEGEWKHPFTDVPAWADKYVGYAYEKTLTKGVSDTKFGTDNANSATYITFMLRALGYSDADGDFKWDAPHALAKGLGLLPSIVDTENFLRADIVTVSYAALSVNIKDSTDILAEKLVEQGAFTAEVYGKNYLGTKITDKENEGKTKLTAEQIYSDAANAVFYITAYDKDGKVENIGSGFFIDESGIGVTATHIIDGAAKIEVTIPSTGAKHEVSGIYDMSRDYQWAILKIDGTGFDAIKTNPLPVKGASSVYAIGSPAGLQNTVSEGIVSNSRRFMYGYSYIQTTAAVSEGSYGGALVNRYGEVIGIVYDTYYEGQNINFVIPISVIAIADLSEVTPVAEYKWNTVWYTTDTDEVTLKAGEVVNLKYGYDYDTVEYSFPTVSFKSGDNTVATVTKSNNYRELRIAGHKAGTTEIVFSNNLTEDTHKISVTVEENPELTAPSVKYTASATELDIQIGATKTVDVEVFEYGITDAPDGNLAGEYTVKSSTTKIKASLSFDLHNLPYITLKITGERAATGTVTLSNKKTKDTLVINVTVREKYDDTYSNIVTAIKEKGEIIDNADDKYNGFYFYKVAVPEYEDESVNLYVDPNSEDILFNYDVVSSDIAGGDVSGSINFTLTKGKKLSYDIALLLFGIDMKCTGKITDFKNFGKNLENMKHETLECPEIYKEEVSDLLAGFIAGYLVSMGEDIFPILVPGFDISDLGFVSLKESLSLYE